jgi:hypothetical protein
MLILLYLSMELYLYLGLKYELYILFKIEGHSQTDSNFMEERRY